MARHNRRRPGYEGAGPVSPEKTAKLLHLPPPSHADARAAALAARPFLPEAPPVGLGRDRAIVHTSRGPRTH